MDASLQGWEDCLGDEAVSQKCRCSGDDFVNVLCQRDQYCLVNGAFYGGACNDEPCNNSLLFFGIFCTR